MAYPSVDYYSSLRLAPISRHRIAANEEKRKVLLHLRTSPTNALRSLVRSSVPVSSIRPCGDIFRWRYEKGTLFIPMARSQGPSSDLSGNAWQPAYHPIAQRHF